MQFKTPLRITLLILYLATVFFGGGGLLRFQNKKYVQNFKLSTELKEHKVAAHKMLKVSVPDE